MGAPSKFDPAMCDEIVTLMAEGDSKEAVSARLGISKQTFNEWSKADSEYFIPEFSDAVKRGEQLSLLWWEDKLKAASVGENKDANATLMIFNMKNRFKETWADMQTVNHNHNLSAEDLSDEELARIALGGRSRASKA